MKKTVLNWSSGKDAAFAYHLLKNEGSYRVDSLLTAVSEAYDRVSMHGTRTEILERQAELMAIPITKMVIPAQADMEDYNKTMQNTLSRFIENDIKTFAFGDIHLDDLRKYREEQLAKIDAEAIFPLWKKNTRSLIGAMEDSGIVAKIICVNDRYLDPSFLGRIVDRQLMNELPDNIDPCGENGEYHTLVINAPFFRDKMNVREGEIVYKKYDTVDGKWDSGFYYLDMIPEE